MNLSEKMMEWGNLKKQLDELEVQIQAEVLPLKSSQIVGDVIAEYRKSSTNGKYDYEIICHDLNSSPALVEKFTVVPEPYVDYTNLAKEAGMTDELKAKWYTPATGGTPKVTLKFVK